MVGAITIPKLSWGDFLPRSCPHGKKMPPAGPK